MKRLVSEFVAKSIDRTLPFSHHPYWLILAKCFAKFGLKSQVKTKEKIHSSSIENTTHGAAMGTKMAVTFANIFMAKVETEILKPLIWKQYIDDIFSLWTSNRKVIMQFIEQANKHHPKIKFTAEISETDTTFLDTNIYKRKRFRSNSILDVRTQFKPTETFQYAHFSLCHPPGVKEGFIKGKALRLLRTKSSKKIFEEQIQNLNSRLRERGYPENLFQRTLSEVQFESRKLAFLQKPKDNKRILPFVTHHHPAVPKLKQIPMKDWHLIEQPTITSQRFLATKNRPRHPVEIPGKLPGISTES